MTWLTHLGAGRGRAVRLAALCLAVSVACLAAAGPAAAVVSKKEALFHLGLPLGTTAVATDQASGQIYLYEQAAHRVDEYSPWGRLVKGIGWDVAPGAVNEQQEVRVRAAQGAFKLSFEGEQTPDLKFDATAKEVEEALDGIESIKGAGGQVSVTEHVGSPDGKVPYLYLVAFKGSLAGTDVPQLAIEDGAVGLEKGDPSTVREVRTRAEGNAGGTGLEDCTPESGCQEGKAGEGAGQVGAGAAVRGLAVGPKGDLYVSEGDPNDRVQELSPSGRFLRAFGGDVIRDGAAGEGMVKPGSSEIASVLTTEKAFRVGQPIEGTGIEAGTRIAALAKGKITLSQPAGPTATGTTTALNVPPGPKNVAANEVQTVALSANVSGGTFTLTFKTPNPNPSEATAIAIPSNATAAEVEAKLDALANMKAGGGEVEVSGPAGGPWEVEFKGARYTGSDVMRLQAGPEKLKPEGEGTVAVSSESGEEVCEAAAECQAGAVEGARVQFAGGERGDAEGPAALGASILFVANGLRIERFDPTTGAYLGDLPDPGAARGSAPFFGLGIAHLASGPGSSAPLYFDFPASVLNGEVGSKYVYALDPASGAPARTLTLNPGAEYDGKPGGLAVDPAGGLYAIDVKGSGPRDDHVIAFGPEGHQLAPAQADEEQCEKGAGTDRQGLCEEVLGIQAGNSGGGFNALGTGPAGDLYVAGRAGGGEEFFQAYGPAPLAFESPPPAPPAIEDQFAASVYAGGAEVRAKINPRFFSGDLGTTRYYVQYASAACLEEGEAWKAPCVADRPAPPGTLLKGGPVGEGLGVAVLLEGLAAATTYRYRFVAEGTGAPGAVLGVGGELGKEGKYSSFTTPRAPGAPEACPNEAFRSGPAAALPDCRAYEMVSPLDKGGGDVAVLGSLTTEDPLTLDQSAVSGDRFSFGTYKSFGAAESTPATSMYVAARGPGGWQSHPVSPRRTTPLGPVGQELIPEVQMFSPDLCEAWVRTLAEPPLALGAVAEYWNLYRRSDEECGGPGYEALTTVRPQVPSELFQLELQGVSADGSEALYAAAGQLSEDAPALAKEPNAIKDPMQLYAQRRGEEQLRFVCTLPEGEPSPRLCSAGWGGPRSIEGQGLGAQLQGAVSADGERAFWTEGAENGPIYMRTHPSREPSAFVLGSATGTATLTEGSPTVKALLTAKGKAKFTEGSATATLLKLEVGRFAPGEPVEAAGVLPAGTEVLGVSKEENSLILTLSKAATASSASATIQSHGSEPFAVGQTITGNGIPFGTKVEATAPKELTLSNPVGRLSEPKEAMEAKVVLNAAGPCSEPEQACTIAVSGAAEAQRATEVKEVKGSRFLAGAADGSRAVFSIENALYEARIEAEEGHLVANDTRIATGYDGFLGASEDASRVYFASTEALAGANDEGRSPVKGEPNLYLYDANRPEGQRFAFIGTLSAADANPSQPGPLDEFIAARSARVSPDGLAAAFESSAPLTGYDNTDRNSGKADTEAFLYDAAANGGKAELVCASCNPTGARPLGAAVKIEKEQIWASALIPGAWNDLYASRPLSTNGRRLFFESFDALLPADTNGAEDVYEWEAAGEGGCTTESAAFSPAADGCLYLISSGKSPAGSEFLDADPKGRNVFFTTLASLLPQDPGLTDVYDAREKGGLPGPPESPAACQGEACQSSPPPPNAPTPASAGFEGPGNAKEGTARRCAKGKAHRKGRCAKAQGQRRHRKRGGRR